jgi:hypothetical protein
MKFLSAKRLLLGAFIIIALAIGYTTTVLYADEDGKAGCRCWCSTDGIKFYVGSWGKGTGCDKSCSQCWLILLKNHSGITTKGGITAKAFWCNPIGVIPETSLHTKHAQKPGI